MSPRTRKVPRVAARSLRTYWFVTSERASDYDVGSVHLAMAWPWILRKNYDHALRLIDAARSQFAGIGV